MVAKFLATTSVTPFVPLTSLNILVFLALHSTLYIHVNAGHFFGAAINELPGQCGDDGLKCPWYRNLARQIPPQEGCPASDQQQQQRKYGNCLSDQDCCPESYCCFSICHGISRCYNPYINKFTDNLHNFTGTPPCPTTQAPCSKNDTSHTLVEATEKKDDTKTSTTPAETTTIKPTETTTTKPTETTTIKPTKTKTKHTTARTKTTTTKAHPKKIKTVDPESSEEHTISTTQEPHNDGDDDKK